MSAGTTGAKLRGHRISVLLCYSEVGCYFCGEACKTEREGVSDN